MTALTPGCGSNSEGRKRRLEKAFDALGPHAGCESGTCKAGDQWRSVTCVAVDRLSIPLLTGEVVEFDALRPEGLWTIPGPGPVASELERLDTIGKTRRDLISDEDWDWFCSHPLRSVPGISWGEVIPELVAWLRRRGGEGEGTAAGLACCQIAVDCLTEHATQPTEGGALAEVEHELLAEATDTAFVRPEHRDPLIVAVERIKADAYTAGLAARSQRPEDREGVGTGAGEGATGQDTGTAGVTRSTDCPEAPAQAHPLAQRPEGEPPRLRPAVRYDDTSHMHGDWIASTDQCPWCSPAQHSEVVDAASGHRAGDSPCDCGHDWHLHDPEAVPALCLTCGDPERCGSRVHDLMMLALHGHPGDLESALRATLAAQRPEDVTVTECPDKACAATGPEGCRYPHWRMCGHPIERPSRTAEVSAPDCTCGAIEYSRPVQHLHPCPSAAEVSGDTETASPVPTRTDGGVVDLLGALQRSVAKAREASTAPGDTEAGGER